MSSQAHSVQPSAAPAPCLNVRNARALVADDNVRSMEIISQVLLGFGVRIAARCTSASEAKAELGINLFDLVIMDGEMPGEDGFDVTSHIRSEPDGPNYPVPVIIVSGFTPKRKVFHARDVGANLIIAKPIVPRVLLTKIEWLARHPRPFVACDSYCGPDRRYHNVPLKDVTERRAGKLRLMAAPERALSQDDIDSLFG